MRERILITAALCFIIGKVALAQSCETAFYLFAGKEVVYSKYNKDGDLVGKDVGTVSNVKDDGQKLRSDYRLIKYEADGKVKEDTNARIFCENGDLKISFQVPDMKNGKSNEAFFSYPNNMKPGQELESKLEMNINGVVNGKKTDVYFKVENRKVTAKETVKTPAGGYNSVKIEYDLTIRIKVMGIGIPMKVRIHEWFSPGYGVIKTESLDKDGKLMETAVLTSIK